MDLSLSLGMNKCNTVLSNITVPFLVENNGENSNVQKLELPW